MRILHPLFISSSITSTMYSPTLSFPVPNQYWWQASCYGHNKYIIRTTFTMSYLLVLHHITEHNDHSTLPFIDHLPKVSDSGLHGTLGYYECSLMLITLKMNVLTLSTNLLIKLPLYIHSHKQRGCNLQHLSALHASGHLHTDMVV